MIAESLRLATDDDVDRLCGLVESSIRGFGGEFYDGTQMQASLEHLYGIDRQLIADQTYYLIEGGGEIVASGGWSFRQTAYGSDNTTSGRDSSRRDPRVEPAAIRAFYVHPNHKRRGLGRRLHETCERAAAAAGYRRLELLSTEMGAVFYRELGYVVSNSDQVELPGGIRIPLIHMVKPIAVTQFR